MCCLCEPTASKHARSVALESHFKIVMDVYVCARACARECMVVKGMCFAYAGDGEPTAASTRCRLRSKVTSRLSRAVPNGTSTARALHPKKRESVGKYSQTIEKNVIQTHAAKKRDEVESIRRLLNTHLQV